MMEQFGDNLEEQIPKSERDNYEGEWVDAEKIMKEQVQDVTKSTASELAAFKESGIHDLLE